MEQERWASEAMREEKGFPTYGAVESGKGEPGTASQPKYMQDRRFVDLLLAGNKDAWNLFYGELYTKMEFYIRRKYPDTFTDIAVEEIRDGTTKRLMENDYRALRAYRGDCAFTTYITRATDWEIQDWLRKQADRLVAGPTISLDEEGVEQPSTDGLDASPPGDEELGTPAALRSLSNDLRWAFLLRYYDYFGFPLDEIRLLARAKNLPIFSITSKLIKYLDSRVEDVLVQQREKQRAFRDALQKTCYEIYKLNLKEQKMLYMEEELFHSSPSRTVTDKDKIALLRIDRDKLERKRKRLLTKQQKVGVTTPYDIIAEILGEDSVSTIRSRVFLAKKQLSVRLSGKDKDDETIDPDSSSKR